MLSFLRKLILNSFNTKRKECQLYEMMAILISFSLTSFNNVNAYVSSLIESF